MIRELTIGSYSIGLTDKEGMERMIREERMIGDELAAALSFFDRQRDHQDRPIRQEND